MNMYDVPYDTHIRSGYRRNHSINYIPQWQNDSFQITNCERASERVCLFLPLFLWSSCFLLSSRPPSLACSRLLSLLIRSVCECLMTHLFKMFVHTSNWNDFFSPENSHICLCEHDRLAFCRMFVFNRWGVGNTHEHPLPWNKQQLFR